MSVAGANVRGMDLDLTATTADLAATAADLLRLVPSRPADPVLSGVLITATADGVTLIAGDRDRTGRAGAEAMVHTDGRVLVPAKPLAETLRALDVPQIRLVVEGTRLALRAPGCRFALPLLDADNYPVPAPPPARCGEVDAAALRVALVTVAATASRDDALPLFSGVRLRADGDTLVLLASDRYRMALARLPWRPAAGGPALDVSAPAGLLAEVAKQLPQRGAVSLHVDTDRLVLGWAGAQVTTAVFDGSALHESKIDLSRVDTWVESDADALAGAVRRVGLYTDQRGAVLLEVGDAEVLLRAADRQAGEAEESVKATVSGGRTGPAFQSRYLTDALRVFAGGPVRIGMQAGMRATVFTAGEPAAEQAPELTYVVMPMLPPRS